MIIAVTPSYALGYSLFNHANLMAAGWEYETRFVNPCFGKHAELFPRLRSDPLCAGLPGFMPAGAARTARGYLARAAVRLGKEQTAREANGRSLPGTRLIASGWSSTLEDDGGIVHVDGDEFRELVRSNRFVLVSGPLFRFGDQERYLRHRPRIIEYFRFPPAVLQQGSARASAARRDREILVGVHVRRRDYAGFVGGKYFYDWETYERLMREIARSWGSDRVAFLVTSDEPFPGEFAVGLQWGGGPGDISGDLASLAACDMVMGPPSTFSKWAAFSAKIPFYRIKDSANVPDRDEFVSVAG